MAKTMTELRMELTKLSLELDELFKNLDNLNSDMREKEIKILSACDRDFDDWNYSLITEMIEHTNECLDDLENAKYCLDTCVTMEDVKEYKALEEKNKN